MLRVNSRDVLVVPPFECAWLELQDYGVEGGCCLCFETRGEHARPAHAACAPAQDAACMPQPTLQAPPQ